MQSNAKLHPQALSTQFKAKSFQRAWDSRKSGIEQVRKYHRYAKWLCLPTPNAIQNHRPLPPLPSFPVFKSPPGSLLKDSKALPQSRNPLIDRSRRHRRLRAKEPRKMCPQALKRSLLQLKPLMLHSKCHRNRTLPTTLYTV